MKRILFLFIISVFSFQLAYSQQMQNDNQHPLAGSYVFSLNVGGTYTVSDYSNFVPGFTGQASAEYYFKLKSKSAIGLRAFGSGGRLSGSNASLTPDKFYTNYYQLGGGVVYSYYFSKQFIPYVFSGLSYQWYIPKDVNSVRLPRGTTSTGSLTQLLYDAEIGFHSYLTKDVMLNVGVGVNIGGHDLLDGLSIPGTGKDYFFTGYVGVSYALFSKSNSDADGDGVMDDIDQCPNTPPGVKVTLDGCPIDSDGDGVPDYLDECPNTPANVFVDKSGCPIDSDSDGVPDYLDKCPGTPAGTKVDENGCKKVVVTEKQPVVTKKVEPEKTVHVYDPSTETEIEKNIWTDGKQFVIQVSSWSTQERADKMAAKWKSKGHNAFVQKAYVTKYKKTFYRVRIGYFNSLELAKSYSKTLK